MKVMSFSAIVSVGFFFFASLAIAEVRCVPDEYSTIQSAINAASNSDIVIVADGNYTGEGNRNITFQGKAITVKSEKGPRNCIIDCEASRESPRCGFDFNNSESRSSVLEGFTIINGYGQFHQGFYAGGAIYCEGSGPTIRRCILKNNMNDKISFDTDGGAIACYSGAYPLIENCIISDNQSYWSGGINISGSSPTIWNCIILDNSADYGGAIVLWGAFRANIFNCTILNNSADTDGGGIYSYGSTQTIVNCILWGNGDDLYGCSATYSCIEDNDSGTGNIYSDPCFVSGPMGDLYLSQIAAGQYYNSPCVDAGSDSAANLKMDLKTTRTDGFGDTGPVDMGYHYSFIIDLNGDAFVNFIDYAFFADDWQTSPDPYDPNSGDIIKNGWVDIYDLAELCAQWLTCPVIDLVTKATNPIPADGANDVNLIVILQWLPGENDFTHDVYFGTDFNEVNNASVANTAVYMGNQDANVWDINNFDVNGLEPNKSYYWRIDEVAGYTAKGDVWTFKTDPRLPGEVDTWRVDARCFLDGPPSAFDDISVKDPSIVYSGGKWHLFYTGRDSSYWRMGYASATSIPDLNNATRYYMSALNGGSYFCAPQVFWFESKSKWYLIYQSGLGATYSTNTDIGNPAGWAAGQSMGFSDGIDFWCISDGTNVYCFYSAQDGSFTIKRRSTTVANFPTGWSSPSVVATDTFEAPCVYKSKADGKYYMMIENLYRYFELWTASSPGGTWTKLKEQWAHKDKLIYNADHWTDQVSHGEILRSGTNERMEINNINQCEILIQGMPAGNYGDYANWPYDLGLIRNY